MLTEVVSEYALRALDATQYAGAAFLMALESMIVPVPSEAVMPFVGFQVADGKWDLWLAIAATSAGSLLGSLLSYAMGYFGGRPLVVSLGRYLLLSLRDLERTEAFFRRREGAWTVFVARFIPVVRHFISIPAGTGRMPLIPFLVATTAGATLWNSFLLALGFRLRENWRLVENYSVQIDLAVLALCLGACGWFLIGRLRRRSPP